MSDEPIDGIDEAIQAAKAAKQRMQVSEPGTTAQIRDSLGNVLDSIRARPSLEPRIVRPSAEVEAARKVRLQAFRIASVIPGGRRWARFDASELAARVPSKQAIAASRTAVDASWVVWTGSSGRGKTSLACAALVAWIERCGGERRPMFVPAWKLAVARARHPLGQGEPELVEQAMVADLLVLDEIGDQHGPTSAVPEVIFEREAEGRATWFTTYLGREEVSMLLGGGIARRIFERAMIIDCGKGSAR